MRLGLQTAPAQTAAHRFDARLYMPDSPPAKGFGFFRHFLRRQTLNIRMFSGVSAGSKLLYTHFFCIEPETKSFMSIAMQTAFPILFHPYAALSSVLRRACHLICPVCIGNNGYTFLRPFHFHDVAKPIAVKPESFVTKISYSCPPSADPS